jgi:hypothetical protein
MVQFRVITIRSSKVLKMNSNLIAHYGYTNLEIRAQRRSSDFIGLFGGVLDETIHGDRFRS